MPNNHEVVLNVAEKPSVARALAHVFGQFPSARDCGMRRDVHQIFTHENVTFPLHAASVAPHTMITTSVRGHLVSQDFGAAYGWSQCDPHALFTAPIVPLVRPDLEPLRDMLRRLATTCTAVILWLDCDREGEAIGDEVRSVCWEGNGRLPVWRAKFSTVLAPEIRRALFALGSLNENFVQAVQARSELDLRVGAAFTRFQTLRLQKKFDDFASGVISYGPCQFPTLGFVVERWARIETFVPEDFWSIAMSITVDAAGPNNNHGPNEQHNQAPRRQVHFQWKRGSLYDHGMAAYLYESCLDAGEAVVTSLTGRPKNKWRPVPLATVELQKRAARFLRLGAETVMTLAEELYQQGLVSYPRTETEKFRPEFQHRPLIQQFANCESEFTQYANGLMNGGFQNPRAGQHDDEAHPPITPCKAVDPNSITDARQRGVYILIVKHYLACCSRDATGRETQICVRLGSEEFSAKGLMILEKNWLEVYQPWERWSTGQGELPPLQVGSRIRPSSLLLKDGRTSPPQPISEAELIALMDRNGIGTDATIAQHIATIQERDYAKKDHSMRFLPTKLGIALIEAYNSMGYQLNKPDLRRETEAECNDIAAGRKSKDQVMASLLAKMKECFELATQEATKLDEAIARHYSRLGSNNASSQVLNPNFSKCGACQHNLALKQTLGGNLRRKLLFCNTCQIGWNLPRGNCQPKTENDNGSGLPVLCPICDYQVVRILRGDGYEGNGYHVCPKCFSDPPIEHGGSQNGGEFRCFTCQHPTCPLASGVQGGGEEVFRCPFCGDRDNGSVCLRRNSRGFILGCNKYSQNRCSYTIWLPKECQTVVVESANDENRDRLCHQCSNPQGPVKKITMTFRPGSVPPSIGGSCTVCLLCDATVRRDLEISLPRQGQVNINGVRRNQAPNPGRFNHQGANAGRGNRGATHTSTRGRSATTVGSRRTTNTQNNHGGRGHGGQGFACYKCGQPGHFANQCPQR